MRQLVGDLRERQPGAEHRRGVHVVPAGVRDPADGRRPRHAARVLHGQRVEVRAQGDPLRPVAAGPGPMSQTQAAARQQVRRRARRRAAARRASAVVRTSVRPSSGCAWMSRRIATSSSRSAATRAASRADIGSVGSGRRLVSGATRVRSGTASTLAAPVGTGGGCPRQSRSSRPRARQPSTAALTDCACARVVTSTASGVSTTTASGSPTTDDGPPGARHDERAVGVDPQHQALVAERVDRQELRRASRSRRCRPT